MDEAAPPPSAPSVAPTAPDPTPGPTAEQVAELTRLLALDAGPEPEVPKPVDPVSLPNIESTFPTTPAAPNKRARLYSCGRPGFMRSTREEGIGDELAKMRAEAQGSPFFDAGPTERPRAKLIERLQRKVKPK